MLNVNDQLVVNCTTACKVWWLYGTGLYDIKTLSYMIVITHFLTKKMELWRQALL